MLGKNCFDDKPWTFVNHRYVSVISLLYLESKKNYESLLLIPILGDHGTFEENRRIKEESEDFYRHRQGVSRLD